MNLHSMTGFSRSDGSSGPYRWHWEIRTVNGRGLDIRLRLPPGLEALEPRIRKLAGATLHRGNCQVSLTLNCEDRGGEWRVNEAALEQVLEGLAQVAARIPTAPPQAGTILGLKGVMEFIETAMPEEEKTARDTALLASFGEALDGLVAMRRAEGERLGALLSGQLDAIEALAGEAAALPALTPEAIAEKLRRQVDSLLAADSGLLEPERLYAEAALLATKNDIREELDRLHAHIAAARDLLAGSGPVGRKLDFLIQEFNREANTLCSKSSDKALTGLGLKMKARIDQMREQVQNVE